eukprot:scaffold161853_cov16-Tisochrysis_lutea.AAC.1
MGLRNGSACKQTPCQLFITWDLGLDFSSALLVIAASWQTFRPIFCLRLYSSRYEFTPAPAQASQ